MNIESNQKKEQNKQASQAPLSLMSQVSSDSKATDLTNSSKKKGKQVGISIMTDPELHPLPITPNDPLQIFQINKPAASLAVDKQSSVPMLKEHPMGYRSPREILEVAGLVPSLQESKDEFDIEILDTEANPNSLFKDALPSLKLKYESTESVQDKLNPAQELQPERQKSHVVKAPARSSQLSSDLDIGAPQGQGSAAQGKEEIKGRDSTPSPAELLGNAISKLHLSKQTSLISETDVQYQRLLQLTHQGFSNISAQSIAQRGPPCFSRYFLIKSFSEEDVHKAIKYQVWSSTEAGNRILDAAYADVQEQKKKAKQANELDSDDDALLEQARREAEVYLLFSVNKSRHFCGVARMGSHVRNNVHHKQLWKNAHKWPGSIDVQWLWIKDIPNTQFIHIENPLNENKPVCQGRDCQEIYPKVGERVLFVFATFKPMTRIFDDFAIYDEQEKHRAHRAAFKEKKVYPGKQEGQQSQMPNHYGQRQQKTRQINHQQNFRKQKNQTQFTKAPQGPPAPHYQQVDVKTYKKKVVHFEGDEERKTQAEHRPRVWSSSSGQSVWRKKNPREFEFNESRRGGHQQAGYRNQRPPSHQW